VADLLVLDTLLPHGSSLKVSQRALPRAIAIGDILNILEADSGHKALALPRLVDLAVKLVDLLEGQTLSLVDHAPNECDADEAETAPHEEDLGLQVGVARTVVDHIRGGVSNRPVEKPVGGGGHGE